MENKRIKLLEPFTIEGFEYQFRFQKIKVSDSLSLMTQFGVNSFDSSSFGYNFILDHTEILLEGVWTKVKEGENFFPETLGENLPLLQKITLKFLTGYLMPAFQKSDE